MTEPATPLGDALAVEADADGWLGRVPAGWDVFGIPHGGFLAALAGAAVLEATGAPDLFSMTTHFLRKASVGPIRLRVAEAGASRRFRSVRAEACQDGQVSLAVSALVGDRTTIAGPSWHRAAPWRPTEAALVPPDTGFAMPSVSERMGLRLEAASTGFATGAAGAEARVRAVVEKAEPSVLAAIVACDLTPPAIWNALGPTGWVPTVELTVHVRARPAPGPMTVEATTRHVSAGFLEEDAEVFDAEGTLVVQSRQLARYSESPTSRPL